MESKENIPEQYEQLLRKNAGLLNINCKIPVRDRSALALVYTPGVGAACKEIEKDESKAFELTNKMNSVLIVTDSSGFDGVKGEKWNNYVPLPYLEATCIYYKSIANLDCYPIIIDYASIKNSKDFTETVSAIMPAYSAVEFYGVCSKRAQEFEEIIGSKKKDFAYIGGQCKRKMEAALKGEGIKITASMMYAGILRAALDLQCYQNLNGCLEYIIKELKANKDKYAKNDNFYSILEYVVKKSADYLIDTNKISDKKSECIRKKFISFSIEGNQAWVGEYPNNYLQHKRSINDNSLLLHRRYRGMIETGAKIQIKDPLILDKLLSWPSLDHIANIIKENPEQHLQLTCRSNYAAIITNGTAILGFGNIGALAGLPVMEGKSVLFKLFGALDVIPLCIQERNPKKLITIIQRISPSFSAINLEDINAPDCFEIESTLVKTVPYPVFHDDQHGTAIVVLSGIINSLKLTNKSIDNVKIVMNGAGAAGLSVTELLVMYGAKNLVICDTVGAIYSERPKNMNPFKDKLASLTNLRKEKGPLKEILKGADIFIGVSAPGSLSKDMIRSMKKNPIIFALANPTPEIMPDEAHAAGAFIIATGRSDFKNQVNNSLAFPGIFRAAIDTRARKITIEMKLAASKAIAGLIKDSELTQDFIIPDSLDSRVPVAVANAVAKEAINSKIAENKEIDEEHVEDNILGWLLEQRLRNWKNISKENLDYSKSQPKPKF